MTEYKNNGGKSFSEQIKEKNIEHSKNSNQGQSPAIGGAVQLLSDAGNQAVCQMLDNTYNGGNNQSSSNDISSLKDKINLRFNKTVQKKDDKTGLPKNVKNGVENLSGLSLDDVSVNYNSSKPAALGALAYTQGNEIHVAPGQERHLPHEAWHVVQQKLGQVRPNMQIDGTACNDNEQLEHEADVMGQKSSAAAFENVAQGILQPAAAQQAVVQRVKDADGILLKAVSKLKMGTMNRREIRTAIDAATTEDDAIRVLFNSTDDKSFKFFKVEVEKQKAIFTKITEAKLREIRENEAKRKEASKQYAPEKQKEIDPSSVRSKVYTLDEIRTFVTDNLMSLYHSSFAAFTKISGKQEVGDYHRSSMFSALLDAHPIVGEVAVNGPGQFIPGLGTYHEMKEDAINLCSDYKIGERELFQWLEEPDETKVKINIDTIIKKIFPDDKATEESVCEDVFTRVLRFRVLQSLEMKRAPEMASFIMAEQFKESLGINNGFEYFDRMCMTPDKAADRMTKSRGNISQVIKEINTVSEKDRRGEIAKRIGKSVPEDIQGMAIDSMATYLYEIQKMNPTDPDVKSGLNLLDQLIAKSEKKPASKGADSDKPKELPSANPDMTDEAYYMIKTPQQMVVDEPETATPAAATAISSPAAATAISSPAAATAISSSAAATAISSPAAATVTSSPAAATVISSPAAATATSSSATASPAAATALPAAATATSSPAAATAIPSPAAAIATASTTADIAPQETSAPESGAKKELVSALANPFDDDMNWWNEGEEAEEETDADDDELEEVVVAEPARKKQDRKSNIKASK